MSAWIVYSKNGNAKCEARKLEYSGEFLGACSVNVSITSPAPIGFEIGDWLEYRGERFELNYDPSVVKNASVESSGDCFTYENIVFNSLSDELTRCDFLDYVPSDNQIHYSSLPNFTFFADTIAKLAERIQVNLDRVYQGDKKWTVEVHPEYVNNQNVTISINSVTCWDALALVKSQFDANFIVKNRVITIGTAGLPVERVFSYGKGNGLITIEKNADTNQKIITRLRAYGSTKNMPTRYYANLKEGLPNNLAVNNLMLPSFPDETLDPYIDSANISELGIREGTVFFDGSGDLEEIYPSMEGMTAEDLKAAGVAVTSTGRLDEILGSESIEDNGIFKDDADIPPFTLSIKDIGFDLNEHLSTESATISLKDGMCGGRDFEIVSCKKDGDHYVLTCNRHYDSGLDLYFPYNSYPIRTGDKFVLLGIEMPDVYIKAASQRLLQSAKNYLAKNDYVRYSYTPQVDAVFMARQHDEAIRNGLNSLHDTIKEGGVMLFEDADIGIEGSVLIDSLQITEYADDSRIPTYEITLRNDKAVGAIDKIQNQIDSIVSGQTSVGSVSGGGYNSSQIKSLILSYGEKFFLSKVKDDRTPHNLGVGKNLEVERDASVGGNVSVGGEIVSKNFAKDTRNGGYAIQTNENGAYEAEVDNIIARILANTYDLLVKNHATFVGDLTSEEFISGILGGKGWSIRTKEFLNAAGITEKKSVAEFDELIVRGTMRVYEFIVSQLLGENDNRIFTGMMEVDHYDALEGKIYLKTNGGRLYNPFRVDDVIIVQQYGGMPSEENNYYVTKQYEFIVTEAGVGEMGDNRLDWIRFRNFTTSMEGGNENLIAEYDTLVRLDNVSDANRKGIIQLMSVGEDTPYMDFIHGAKTDPENSLKGRLGNLGGIYNPLFGWLKEFGAYLTNLYAVGEFVIAHTGENVADSIEIAKGQFRTNFRQTTFDMSEEDNFFTNASLTNNCEHWTLGADTTEYFIVDDLPQFFNFDLYATEDTYAGIAEWKGRDMLRLSASTARQANSLIKKAGTHKVYTNTVENEDGTYTDVYEDVPDTLYLSIRLYVASSGKVDFGFVNANGAFINNSFRYSEDLTAREDGYEIKLSGTWDGKGDFCIASTGDVYVDLLSLTDRPLDNFKITTETKIEQDAQRISLLGKKINGVEGSITNLSLIVDAQEGTISSLVSTTDRINNTITTSGWINSDDSVRIFSEQVNAQGIAKTAEIKTYVDGKVSGIKLTADNIDISANEFIGIINKGTTTISASRINLSGVVTYSMLESNLKSTLDNKATSKALSDAKAELNDAITNLNKNLSSQINAKASTESLNSKVSELNTALSAKANTSSLKALAYKDVVEAATCGSTLIVNGYLNTDYVKVKKIQATEGTIANFTISGKTLTNNANDVNIIIRNSNSATASKRVEIGLSTVLVTGTSGLSSMGLFVDEEIGDASNIALAVSAKNATSNIGLLMMGGAIAGLAEKVGHYASGKTISHEDNVAVAYGASITLPEMNAYDDGHVVTIVSNYTGSAMINCSEPNYMMDKDNSNRQIMSLTIPALSSISFVYVHNLKHTFQIGEKKGCWVKI